MLMTFLLPCQASLSCWVALLSDRFSGLCILDTPFPLNQFNLRKIPALAQSWLMVIVWCLCCASTHSKSSYNFCKLIGKCWNFAAQYNIDKSVGNTAMKCIHISISENGTSILSILVGLSPGASSMGDTWSFCLSTWYVWWSGDMSPCPLYTVW